MPVDLRHVPAAIEYRADTRHHHYVVRWNERVMFDDGKLRASVWFDAGLGDDLAKACAWTYFKACYERGRAVGRRTAGKGPKPQPPAILADDGLYYHGGVVNHEFVCWPGPKEFKVPLKVLRWDHHGDTFESPEAFCGNSDFVKREGPGLKRYRCRGSLGGR